MPLPFPIPRWAWIALGGLLLVLAFYVLLDRYGDSRFKAGHEQADKEWQEASDKLLQKAANASTTADKNANARAADYAAKVEDEKERLDQAQAEGSSPLDVLFGT